MAAPIPVDTLITKEGSQWKATVFRGRRKLYVTHGTSEEHARALARLFIQELT